MIYFQIKFLSFFVNKINETNYIKFILESRAQSEGQECLNTSIVVDFGQASK